MDSVRVRIAPSPTGKLHIGTARTALFNFVFAKKFNGIFILRIEDTDKERSKKEYEEDIVESLKWLGLEWDEFYRQSERIKIYEEYLKRLINEGSAYLCFCAKEDLEKQREDMLLMGKTWQYPGTCRVLDKKTVAENLKVEKPYTIRLKVQDQQIEFDDLVRGKIEFGPDALYDFIIAKDFDEPLYNFAAAIDDYEMKISHVIRGEDHISNTPKQLLISKALGFAPPLYAHLPLILGLDRSKLSKRKGSDVIISDFKKAGFLPEAVVNFLILLGWHPREDKLFLSGITAGQQREILTLQEIINEFSLERVQKGGAVFNDNKLLFFNSIYFKKKTNEDLLETLKENLSEVFGIKGNKVTLRFRKRALGKEQFLKMLELEKGRLKTLKDLEESVKFFFDETLDYLPDLLIWQKADKKDALFYLKESLKIIKDIKDKEFTTDNLRNIFLLAAPLEDRGRMLWPLRVALSGKSASPPPFEIMEILGRKETQKRIESAIKKLQP